MAKARTQVASALLDITGLIDQFGIKLQPLSSLLQAVCAGYRPNPYHNFQHAVSVLHVSYLLHRAGPPNVEGNDQPPVVLSKLELLALFLAALGHDIDHPGVTNAFLCNSYAPLALCYNDESVLENHHAATTWTLLNDSRNDVLGGLAVEERKQVRNLIIKSILAMQVTSPVQWETTLGGLLESGLETSYELGPGKVVAGIMKRIDKKHKVTNVTV